MEHKSGIELIAEERKRQIEVEQWDLQHDADYTQGELMGAAGCYTAHALSKHLEEYRMTNQSPLAKFQVYDRGETDFLVNSGDRGDRTIRKAGWKDGWPWDKKWDKRYKHDKLRSLVIAGALIAAEIDRNQNKFNSEQEVQECDARNDDSSTDDGQQNPSPSLDFTIKGNTELCSSDGLLIQQNKTSNSEATILSAEDVLKKYCKGFAKCDKDYDDHEFEEYWKELKKDENMFSLTLAAMEEYKNRSK